MISHDEPKLFPQEEVYIKILNVKFVDTNLSKNHKLLDGQLLLTTLRVIWYKGNQGLEIPLFYVRDYKEGGGFLKSKNVTFHLHQLDSHSQFMIDYHSKVLRQPGQPYKPQLTPNCCIKFKENREKFVGMLKEALKTRHWNIPIKIETSQGHLAQETLTQHQSKPVIGIAGIKKNIEDKTQYNQSQISNAFQDLNSLKEKARGLVSIANGIKTKIQKKEMSSSNTSEEELREIQSVMFNMGLITDFSSQVTKDLAGKNYYQELAKEVEKLMISVIDKFGGVLALVDVYCMYNRARGTDLISPEDLLIACEKLETFSASLQLRTFTSGVKVLQSRAFNSEAFYQKLVKILIEQPGLTADKLAQQLNINVILMKEQLREAEERGFLCRDESLEGLRYYDNLIIKMHQGSQKDMLINQLQSEIFELRGKGNNYNTLRDNMVEIEMAYRRLLEDKGIFEENMKSKIDLGSHESVQYQHEVEQLRMDITLRSKQNAELAQDIQRLKQINHIRDEELHNLDIEIARRHDQQMHLKGTLEDVVYEISLLREDRKQLGSENLVLQNEARQTQDHINQLQLKADELQHLIHTEQDKQQNLERQLDERERDLSRQNDALFSSQAEINRCKDICEELRKREMSLNASIIEKESINKDTDRQYVQEQSRLGQMRMEVDSLDLDNAKQDKHVESMRRDNDTIKSTIQRQQENNALLKDELLALQRHQQVLEDQNHALLAELDKFTQTDEHLKTTLDRRRRVQEMKDTMNKQLQHSNLSHSQNQSQSQYHRVSLRSPQRQ
eukprot:403372873